MDKKPFEIRKELSEKVDKFQNLAAKDQRTVDENTEMETLRTDIRKLTSDLDDAELLEAGKKRFASQTFSKKEKKELSSYSFQRAINEYIRHGSMDNVDGLEGEMHKEAAQEIAKIGTSRSSLKGIGVPLMVLENANVAKRDSTGQNVTTSSDGGYLVQEEPYMFIESLKNALVLTGLGTRFLTGLVGNLPLLKGGSFAASWIAEGGNVSFTKESFSKSVMQPKNLMVAGAISKQLLVQTSNTAEMLIRTELINALAQGIQNAAINGSGSGAEPTGILNTTGIGSVALGDDGAAIDWANIVALETAVAQENVIGDLAYLTNAKVRGKLKTTLKASGVAGYIWENNEINGYKAAMTNAVPNDLTKGDGTGLSAIIAGVWSELFIGMWGGMDIVVDPYTRADYNEVKLVFSEFADIALRNAEAFAAAKDVLTD